MVVVEIDWLCLLRWLGVGLASYVVDYLPQLGHARLYLRDLGYGALEFVIFDYFRQSCDIVEAIVEVAHHSVDCAVGFHGRELLIQPLMALL